MLKERKLRKKMTVFFNS